MRPQWRSNGDEERIRKMKRRTKRKVKNAVLRAVTVWAGTTWVLAVLGADSAPEWAMVALWLSTAWLTYFGWCNGWFGGADDADR